MKAIATTYSLAITAALLTSTLQAQPAPTDAAAATTAASAATPAAPGVPLAALHPQAPSHYTVQRGDTLWRIAGIFLRQPWQWPQLWGMNSQAIANPHLIYPGQVLRIQTKDGFARLTTQEDRDSIPTVKLSPSARSESLPESALPTLPMHIIEAFMSEPLVVEHNSLSQAPRIVSGDDQRFMLAHGDRAYVQGLAAATEPTAPAGSLYRIFRQATPLKDPVTQEVLGYEAQYLGQAQLLRAGTPTSAAGPATIRITKAKEEIRAGDRLLPEPKRQYIHFVPHASPVPRTAQIVSLYGSTSIRFGAQYQVVAINQGQRDGVQPGLVLSLMRQGGVVRDTSGATPSLVQLPAEANGTAMVFRSFDRVSYALLMHVQRAAQVGDTLVGAQ